MNIFYIHLNLNGTPHETVVPVVAKNLDEAHEWADLNYTTNGLEVTRIRPKVIHTNTNQ